MFEKLIDSEYKIPKRQDKRRRQYEKHQQHLELQRHLFTPLTRASPGSSKELSPTADDGRQGARGHEQRAIRAGPHSRNQYLRWRSRIRCTNAYNASLMIGTDYDLRLMAVFRLMMSKHHHTLVHTYVRLHNTHITRHTTIHPNRKRYNNHEHQSTRANPNANNNNNEQQAPRQVHHTRRTSDTRTTSRQRSLA